MRIASRHMPKYVAMTVSRISWLYLAVMIAGFIFLLVSNPFYTIIFVLLFCGLFLVGRKEMRQDDQHLRALAAKRDGGSICDFARDFEMRQIDAWIVRAVYEQLQQHLKHVHPAFPVRAADRLEEDLRLDAETLEMDIVEEIEQRTGRRVDGASENPYAGPVLTVGDLVLFFQAQPIKSPCAAPAT